MSDEPTIDLAFIARGLQRLTTEVTEMRRDAAALTPLLLSVERKIGEAIRACHGE